MAPPVAVKIVFEPLHIVTLEPALITGNGFTDTVIVPVFVQPATDVPVIV